MENLKKTGNMIFKEVGLHLLHSWHYIMPWILCCFLKLCSKHFSEAERTLVDTYNMLLNSFSSVINREVPTSNNLITHKLCGCYSLTTPW